MKDFQTVLAQNLKLVFQRPAGTSVSIKMVPLDAYGNDLSAGGVVTLSADTAAKIMFTYSEDVEILPVGTCDFRFSTDQSVFFCRAGTAELDANFKDSITPTLANMAELPATYYGLLSEIL